MWFATGTTPVVEWCKVDSNTNTATEATQGIGIYAYGGSFKNNEICNNNYTLAGSSGGGIYLGSYGSATIDTNDIHHNGGTTNAITTANGGGIRTNISTSLVIHNTVRNNISGSGGGIYANGSCIIAGNDIYANLGYYGGGAYATTNSTFCYNKIYNNTANLSGGSTAAKGGGLILWADNITVHDNLIYGNSATTDGGGVYLDAQNTFTIKFINNTVADNHTGGGIDIERSNAASIISNNIIYSNAPYGLKYTDTFSATYSSNCAYGNSTNYTPVTPSGTGNITSDPLFMNAENNDYHLSSASPCIDAGDDSAVQAGWTDLYEKNRSVNILPVNEGGSIVDIGAAEYQDTTAPEGSIVIDGGVEKTHQQTVTLTLSATDTETGIALVQISNDGVNWQDELGPYVFPRTTTWTLSSGDGLKTVHVKYTDAGGNSTVKEDTTTLTLLTSTDIASVRNLAVGSYVGLEANVVSVGSDAFSDGSHFYIQDSSGSAGIRINTTDSTIKSGDTVTIVGELKLDASNELFVDADLVGVTGCGEIRDYPTVANSEELADYPGVMVFTSSKINPDGTLDNGIAITTAGLLNPPTLTSDGNAYAIYGVSITASDGSPTILATRVDASCATPAVRDENTANFDQITTVDGYSYYPSYSMSGSIRGTCGADILFEDEVAYNASPDYDSAPFCASDPRIYEKMPPHECISWGCFSGEYDNWPHLVGPTYYHFKNIYWINSLGMHNGNYTVINNTDAQYTNTDYNAPCGFTLTETKEIGVSKSFTVDNLAVQLPLQPQMVVHRKPGETITIGPIELHDGVKPCGDTAVEVRVINPYGGYTAIPATVSNSAFPGSTTVTVSWDTTQIMCDNMSWPLGAYNYYVTASHNEYGWSRNWYDTDGNFIDERNTTAGPEDEHDTSPATIVSNVEVHGVDGIDNGLVSRTISYDLSKDVKECYCLVYDPLGALTHQLPLGTAAGHNEKSIVFPAPLVGKYTLGVYATEWSRNNKVHRNTPAFIKTDELCRHSVSLLNAGTLGGKVRLRFQVSAPTSCLNVLDGIPHGSIGVLEEEITDLHSVSWNVLAQRDAAIYEPGSISTDEYGRSTAIFYVDWDTTQVHNGTHRLQVINRHSSGDGIDYVKEFDVTVKNLTIDDVAVTRPGSNDTSDVICWNGTDSVPVTVNVSDNDLSDPINLTLTIYPTNANNGEGWADVLPTRVMTATMTPGTSSYTFVWDGKMDKMNPNDPLEEDRYADPWTYTFDVVASQEDSNPVVGSTDLEVTDTVNYRSKYLNILRAYDTDGITPITKAQFAGVDNNDTPNNPNDDKNKYYIRFYNLKDSGSPSLNAAEGSITLYAPTMSTKFSSSVDFLRCVDHDLNCDGLRADSSYYGIKHGLLVSVPTSSFQYKGDYLFVLSMRDDHCMENRDHKSRPALALNCALTVSGDVQIVQPISAKPVGGKVPVTVRVKTCNTTLKEMKLKFKEQTSLHDCSWEEATSSYELIEGSSSTDADGVTTADYKMEWETTKFKEDKTDEPAVHNSPVKGEPNSADYDAEAGPHLLKVEALFACPDSGATFSAVSAKADGDCATATVRNLVIDSVSPSNVVAWTGSGNVPITVKVADNDLLDPIKVIVELMPTDSDNFAGWKYENNGKMVYRSAPVRTLTKTIDPAELTNEDISKGSTSVTLTWDGKNEDSALLDPWTYTYEVKVEQCAKDASTGPVIDHVTYRSLDLEIRRYQDGGVSVYQPEWIERETETGPKTVGLFYNAISSENKPASEGQISFYKPELTTAQGSESNIANLDCKKHGTKDGLNSTSHELKFSFPAETWADAGYYLFVVSEKDNTDVKKRYRDHQKRWALDIDNRLPKIEVKLKSVSYMAKDAAKKVTLYSYGNSTPALPPGLQAGTWPAEDWRTKWKDELYAYDGTAITSAEWQDNKDGKQDGEPEQNYPACYIAGAFPEITAELAIKPKLRQADKVSASFGVAIGGIDYTLRNDDTGYTLKKVDLVGDRVTIPAALIANQQNACLTLNHVGVIEEANCTWKISIKEKPYTEFQTLPLVWCFVKEAPIESNSWAGLNRPTCRRVYEVCRNVAEKCESNLLNANEYADLAKGAQIWLNGAFKITGKANVSSSEETWALLEKDKVSVEGHCREWAILMEMAMRLLGNEAKHKHILPACNMTAVENGINVCSAGAVNPNPQDVCPAYEAHGMETLVFDMLGDGLNEGEGTCDVLGKLHAAWLSNDTGNPMIGEENSSQVINGYPYVAVTAAHHILLMFAAKNFTQCWVYGDPSQKCDRDGVPIPPLQ